MKMKETTTIEHSTSWFKLDGTYIGKEETSSQGTQKTFTSVTIKDNKVHWVKGLNNNKNTKKVDIPKGCLTQQTQLSCFNGL